MEIKNDSIMVTGAAGLIGDRFLKNYSKEYASIIALYRNKVPENKNNIFPVCNDLSSAKLILAPLRGVRCVIHLAWNRTLIGKRPQIRSGQTDVSNLIYLKNLLTAMESVRCPRIVFLSSVHARKNSRNWFSWEKYEAERLILASDIPQKIILRTTFIDGSQSNMSNLYNCSRDLVKTPLFTFIPDGKTPIYPVNIEDVASQIKRACDEELPQQCVNINPIMPADSADIGQFFRSITDKFNQKAKLSIGGSIGNSLYRMVESKSKVERNIPLISDYIYAGSMEIGGHLPESKL